MLRRYRRVEKVHDLLVHACLLDGAEEPSMGSRCRQIPGMPNRTLK
ncbi:unnamed protein product [Ciceribacter sp. T2.26MG-112.2]|nr:unnamed protein product [Ciceribacter naphthalenivorans]